MTQCGKYLFIFSFCLPLISPNAGAYSVVDTLAYFDWDTLSITYNPESPAFYSELIERQWNPFACVKDGGCGSPYESVGDPGNPQAQARAWYRHDNSGMNRIGAYAGAWAPDTAYNTEIWGKARNIEVFDFWLQDEFTHTIQSHSTPLGTVTLSIDYRIIFEAWTENVGEFTESFVHLSFEGIHSEANAVIIDERSKVWDGDWVNYDTFGTLEITFPAVTGDLFRFNAEVESKVAVAPIPEPATMLLLSAGLIGLAGIRRKFKKK
jgi:hypothetical protein